MTVAELRAALEILPPDAPVVYFDSDYDYLLVKQILLDTTYGMRDESIGPDVLCVVLEGRS